MYADDTILISKNKQEAKRLLHLIEEESSYYHMSLNHGKCVSIMYNYSRKSSIKFKNGRDLKIVDTAEYLGTQLPAKVNPRSEIARRISKTMPDLQKLDILWNKANCSRKWKLRIQDAVLNTKLLYGLENIEGTPASEKLLDTFQLKGLRKILKKNTTYIDRENTNENIYKWANEAAGATTGQTNKITINDATQREKAKITGTCIAQRGHAPPSTMHLHLRFSIPAAYGTSKTGTAKSKLDSKKHDTCVEQTSKRRVAPGHSMFQC